MSARDDYPEAPGCTLSAYIWQHEAMCAEIDRLRFDMEKWKDRLQRSTRLRFEAALEIKRLREQQ